MGVHLLYQSVSGAALHLLQNPGTRKDVSIPVVATVNIYIIKLLFFLLSKACLSYFRSLYVNMVGLWVTVSLAVFSGLTMYSIYKDCDPLTNGDVGSSDQVNTAAALSLFRRKLRVS